MQILARKAGTRGFSLVMEHALWEQTATIPSLKRREPVGARGSKMLWPDLLSGRSLSSALSGLWHGMREGLQRRGPPSVKGSGKSSQCPLNRSIKASKESSSTSQVMQQRTRLCGIRCSELKKTLCGFSVILTCISGRRRKTAHQRKTWVGARRLLPPTAIQRSGRALSFARQALRNQTGTLIQTSSEFQRIHSSLTM